MHDLHQIYSKTLSMATEMFEEADEFGNMGLKSKPTRMSDLQVISLAVAAESMSISSENNLFTLIQSDYRDRFPELISRSRFNRRRRALRDDIKELTKRLAMTMGVDSQIDLVDSVPCPVIKNSRERTYRICKRNPDVAPKKGYSAVDRSYFIGYKLHVLTNEFGVIQDMQVTPANVHDLNFLKHFKPECYTVGNTIIGDRGYISAAVQADLFTRYDITLEVPYRKNQKNQAPINKTNAVKRRRIETFFSQLCDQFSLKINLAKTFEGFITRVMSKLAAFSILQRINIEKNRPLNQIKHAWRN
jgi:hypothetical protein